MSSIVETAQAGSSGPDTTAEKPTAIVVVAARLDSSRLPGKALMAMGHLPVIGHVLLRCKRIRGASRIVLATTARTLDDPLVAYAASLGIESHRGPVDNVAQRLLDCAKIHRADYIVRVNGDSPFLDPDLISQGLAATLDQGLDFMTNIPGRTYPYGVAVEIIRTQILHDRIQATDDPQDFEHVTPSLYRDLGDLHARTMQSSHPSLAPARLVVDTAQDLATCTSIATALGPQADHAGFEAVAQTYFDLYPAQAKESV